jgi:hypothetical protein
VNKSFRGANILNGFKQMAGSTEAEDGIDAAARTAGGAPRYSRRLSDKILLAFHHACDQADYEIAEQLLRILENMLTRRTVPPDANRRKSIESLVAAHERLWHLRHPEIQFG